MYPRMVSLSGIRRLCQKGVNQSLGIFGEMAVAGDFIGKRKRKIRHADNQYRIRSLARAYHSRPYFRCVCYATPEIVLDGPERDEPAIQQRHLANAERTVIVMNSNQALRGAGFSSGPLP
jgi:hypothetical protein